MPGQLLPLRLLLAAGARCSACGASSWGSALSFRLKNCSFQSNRRSFYSPGDDYLGTRFFSSRPASSRFRAGAGARDHRRGDFRAESAASQGKSLIEDEAELSDWVDDLKTDSFRLGRSSDSEDSYHDRSRSGKRNNADGDRVRERGRNSLSSRRNPASSRRQWDSDFSAFSNRGKSRSSSDSFSKRRFDSDLEVDEDEDEEEVVLSSRQRRERGSQGTMSSTLARRGGRDLDSRYKRGQGVRSSVLELSEEEEEDDDDDDGDDTDDMSNFEDDFFGDKQDKKEGSVKDAFRISGSPELAEGDAESLPKRSVGEHDSYLSQTRFDQFSLSPLTLKGIKAAGYERMTVVQEATLPIILKGKDVLARAKTGTGKTVAFLLPAIELVVKLPPVDRDQKRHPINVLVICPTRELADQAATEANKLLKYHPTIGVQVVMGGTRLALEQKRMQANPCQVLVATPGRLRDHIENTPGFATRLMGVKVLVLDEADRLLDMGFRKDIEKIVAAVPKQRQTLLFSATVPDEVRQICYIAMKRDLEFINTVEEGSEETHSQVKQMHLVAPLEKHFSILYGILTDHISENVDYKVIVFCTTAMVTKLVADLLAELKLNVREIHSRKPQTYRTRVSKEFKDSKGLILVSSDVSARGVDYPNVTLVIQLGVPADREQYIHRLGRTGRKGKEGVGLLMLAPWEEFFLTSIKDLPITKAPLPLIDPDTRKKVERALAHVEVKNKESAYQAWLGYYNSNKNVGRDKYQLVALANDFSRSMGLNDPPAIPKLVLRKMGLNNIPGLRAK
ncbi:DEAD-box ATP-dependent RNA helicase 31-like [Phoenix dactylifera]|uniref:ATP-dependent RNA helicase n=1 Tax=Phoenix dactylifera TaxID=42345 RepID=A0A8B7C1A6_PHODC|nr:DEAD-box ATP-dependent RNA helicase 31-like [Phoenix dactylifera]